MSDKKEMVKMGVALVVLAGGAFFAFNQIFGDSHPNPASSSSKAKPEKKPRDKPPKKKRSTETARKKSSSKKDSGEEFRQPTSLDYKDCLQYDPFAGRLSTNEALYSLAARTSPFTSPWRRGPGLDAESISAPSVLGNLKVDAVILEKKEAFAVINKRTYAEGDALLNQEGKPIEDGELGRFRVFRVDPREVQIEAGGEIFTFRIDKKPSIKISFPGKKPKRKNLKKPR